MSPIEVKNFLINIDWLEQAALYFPLAGEFCLCVTGLHVCRLVRKALIRFMKGLLLFVRLSLS